MVIIEKNIYTIFIAIFILYLSFTGFFDRVNSIIYDKTVSLNISKSFDKKPILLVELTDKQTKYTKNKWNNILSKISTLKPKSYIFLTKNNLDEKFIQSFLSTTPIYLSSQLQLLHKKERIYKVSEDFNETPNDKHMGYIAPLESNDGVYRYNYYTYDTNIGQVPSLEQRIVDDFSDKPLKEKGRYYINFNHHPTLPLISLNELLNSASIEEVLKEKHIIFGYYQRDMEALLSIPIKNTQINTSQFFTYSLMTLLNENKITYIHGYMQVLTVVLFLLFGILIHTVFKIPFTPLSVIAAITGTYGASWILLNNFDIWLPVGELVFLILIISYLNIWIQQKQSSEKTKKLLLSAADKMKDRISHKTFFNSGEHWKYIAKLITQTLNINKIIFLEKIENDHRLQEIEAANCSFNDILELRRDYEREPYKTAIETKEAVKLSQREFFKNIDDDEIQYLVPLIYSGQVLGFWAFTIKKSALEELSNFNEVIAQYSLEISGLLYQRYEWRHKSDSNGSLLSKFTSLKDNFVIIKIKATFTILEKRLNMLETVINRYDNGVILYDMFGRVFHINKKIINYRISHERAAIELKKINKRQKRDNLL